MKLKFFRAALLLTATILPGIPDTAEGALGWVAAFLSSSYFSGWVTTVLTDTLKSFTKRYPIITPANTKLIAGLWAKLVVAILAGLSSSGLVYLTPVAKYLDSSGLWMVVAGALFFAHQHYISDRGTKRPQLEAVELSVE